jgi:hypothetical protein
LNGYIQADNDDQQAPENFYGQGNFFCVCQFLENLFTQNTKKECES